MAEKTKGSSNWQPAGSSPPESGVIAGTDHVVSFKVGAEGSSKEGHTLIADGDHSTDGKTFDANHDHAHPAGYEARAAYTGPNGSEPGKDAPKSD